MARRNLNNAEKQKIRTNIIKGAQFFENKLAENHFIIVTDNNMFFDVSFCRRDFLHLTGLYVNMSEINFYNSCVNGTFSISNIKNNQKYSRNTLLDKSDGIANLDRFIHSDGNINLYLDIINTPTDIMPAGIFNPAINHTIGFKGTENYARSMRTESSPPDNGGVYHIHAIFKVNSASYIADEIVYVSNDFNVLANLENLKTILDETMIELLKNMCK